MTCEKWRISIGPNSEERSNLDGWRFAIAKSQDKFGRVVDLKGKLHVFNNNRF